MRISDWSSDVCSSDLAKLEIATTRTERQSQIAAEIQETQLVLADLVDRMIAAKVVLRRVEIRAPQGGQVTNLRFHTIGSSIGARSEARRVGYEGVRTGRTLWSRDT